MLTFKTAFVTICSSTNPKFMIQEILSEENHNSWKNMFSQHMQFFHIQTFSLLSGKKFIPFGTSNAILAAATFRTVCRNTFHVLSSSDCRHPYGQPRITVLGFMPPRPVVWILDTRGNTLMM